MRRWAAPFIVVGGATVLTTALLLVLSSARAESTVHKHDYSLFCGTTACTPGGDTFVTCKSRGPFEVYLSMQNSDTSNVATVRVTFQDGDFVDFPLQPKTSFSFSQAAGGTGTDHVIKVTEATSTGNLVGWMSASTHPGNTLGVVCTHG